MATIDILVIGAGKLGSAIAKEMSHQHKNVLVIDKSSRVMDNLDSYDGYVEIGDATDLLVLEKNNIKDIKTVIITTNDDNTNLFLTDVCHCIYKVENIFVRLNDSRKADISKYPGVEYICPFLLSLDDYMNNYRKCDL